MSMLEPRSTKVYNVKNKLQARKILQKAGEVIREGGLVCFPTETVYGLGADAFNDQAVADVFRAKNRSFENPMALHLHSIEEIEKYVVKINRRARMLMEKFMPGPLMMIFEKNDRVSPIVTGGLRKVGIRVPRHEICLDFLQECGTPVAATSANRSGRLACVKAADIMEELGGKMDVLLDVGQTPLGIESTVLDVTSDPPRIIRHGFIPMEEIAVVIGIAPIFSDNVVQSSRLESANGHESRMLVLEGDTEMVIKKMNSYLSLYREKRVGLVVVDETAPRFEGHSLLWKMGPRSDPAVVATRVFEILRELERQELDLVLVEGIPREGLGRTLMIKLCGMAREVIRLLSQDGAPGAGD
jgi:L-threonylcarbamoyladenylate synthase